MEKNPNIQFQEGKLHHQFSRPVYLPGKHFDNRTPNGNLALLFLHMLVHHDARLGSQESAERVGKGSTSKKCPYLHDQWKVIPEQWKVTGAQSDDGGTILIERLNGVTVSLSECRMTSWNDSRE